MNIKHKINSRKQFVSMVLNSKILEVPLETLHTEDEIDEDFSKQLMETYIKHANDINTFIDNKVRNKLIDALQHSIISCGICELIVGTEAPLVIKEYMIISDKLGGNSGLVNASLDTYNKEMITQKTNI
jgi:transcription termination factor NusB